MTETIKKATDLIELLKNDRTQNLSWRCGNRPAAPGSYSVGNVRVYAKAVRDAEKLGAIKIRSRDWAWCVYVLTWKFRMNAA